MRRHTSTSLLAGSHLPANNAAQERMDPGAGLPPTRCTPVSVRSGEAGGRRPTLPSRRAFLEGWSGMGPGKSMADSWRLPLIRKALNKMDRRRVGLFSVLWS